MEYVSVHFENETLKYTFSTVFKPLNMEQAVVVETSTGLEIAYVASKIMDESEANLPKDKPIKPIIRRATPLDLRMHESNKEDARNALAICNECVKELDLAMDLVQATYTLDKSKILFTYVAEHRVDFRELLKLLNSRLHCRVELRQIAIRQRAKFIGGIGPCGRPLCCATFMNNFQSVSINLAKNQGLSLNANKLTGQCGKLKCCLRFEDEMYSQMNEGLPKLNSWVEFEGEKYKVASMNLLTNTVRLDASTKSKMITVDELRNDCVATTRPQRKPNGEGDGSTKRRVVKTVSMSKALQESKESQDPTKGETKSSGVPISIREPISAQARSVENAKPRKDKTEHHTNGNQGSTTKKTTQSNGSTKVKTNTNRNSTTRRIIKKSSDSTKSSSNSSTTRRFFGKKKPTETKENGIRIIEEHEAE